jgi:hypothetical protein
MISVGQKFGTLTVTKIDATGKRAVCICACGNTLEASVAALADGTVTSCGCRPLSVARVQADSREQNRRQKFFVENWRGR